MSDVTHMSFLCWEYCNNVYQRHTYLPEFNGFILQVKSQVMLGVSQATVMIVLLYQVTTLALTEMIITVWLIHWRQGVAEDNPLYVRIHSKFHCYHSAYTSNITDGIRDLIHLLAQLWSVTLTLACRLVIGWLWLVDWGQRMNMNIQCLCIHTHVTRGIQLVGFELTLVWLVLDWIIYM